MSLKPNDGKWKMQEKNPWWRCKVNSRYKAVISLELRCSSLYSDFNCQPTQHTPWMSWIADSSAALEAQNPCRGVLVKVTSCWYLQPTVCTDACLIPLNQEFFSAYLTKAERTVCFSQPCVRWCGTMVVCVDIHVGWCFSFLPTQMWNVRFSEPGISQMWGSIWEVNMDNSDFIPVDPV